MKLTKSPNKMTDDFIKNASLLKVSQFKNVKWKVFIQRCNHF